MQGGYNKTINEPLKWRKNSRKRPLQTAAEKIPWRPTAYIFDGSA